MFMVGSIHTRSYWFPLVGCGVPVGLNDGSMKPSLAYVIPCYTLLYLSSVNVTSCRWS